MALPWIPNGATKDQSRPSFAKTTFRRSWLKYLTIWTSSNWQQVGSEFTWYVHDTYMIHVQKSSKIFKDFTKSSMPDLPRQILSWQTSANSLSSTGHSFGAPLDRPVVNQRGQTGCLGASSTVTRVEQYLSISCNTMLDIARPPLLFMHADDSNPHPLILKHRLGNSATRFMDDLDLSKMVDFDQIPKAMLKGMWAKFSQNRPNVAIKCGNRKCCDVVKTGKTV